MPGGTQRQSVERNPGRVYFVFIIWYLSPEILDSSARTARCPQYAGPKDHHPWPILSRPPDRLPLQRRLVLPYHPERRNRLSARRLGENPDGSGAGTHPKEALRSGKGHRDERPFRTGASHLHTAAG